MIDSSLNAWSCMAMLSIACEIFAAESSSAQQMYYSGGESKNPSYHMIHRRSIWFLMVHRFIILSSLILMESVVMQ